MNDFYEGDPRKPVDLPIGTEQEVHVSAEEKKKIRVEKEKRRGSCVGCIFEDVPVGMCYQDCLELQDQPEYECTATVRDDNTSVICVEVKDESI